MRSTDAMELRKKYPHAYMLALIIAERSRYRPGFNGDNLELGEAMLGDFENYGMSEREYRTAKEKLETHGFATFKTTPKGTIGKLMDTRLFDPLNISNDGLNDGQPTDKRRTTDGQPTGNKKVKKDRIKKGKTLAKASTVSNDAFNVPADAGVSDELLLEEEQRKVMLAEAEASLASNSETEKPFEVPTDLAVWEFATEQGLDNSAVATYLFDREKDQWQIRKRDGSVEEVRDWRKHLTGFCEKYENDRTGGDW